MADNGPMTFQPLDLVAQGQEAATKFVEALSEWAGTAQGAARGGAGGPGAAFTGLLPGGPAELVDRLYDTGVQVLEAQRAMAHGVLEAAAPALQAFTVPTPRGR